MLIAVASDVLRNDAFQLVVGQLIASAGVVALVLHLFRSRAADRSTLYFGVIALLYGLREIVMLNVLQSAYPAIPWDLFRSCITLVIGLPFALYLGSTLGRAYPWFTRAVVMAVLLVALLGAVSLVMQAPMHRVWVVNGIVTVAGLAGWGYIGIFPKVPIDREVSVLRIGLAVLGLFTFYQNLAVVGVFENRGFIEPLGMVFLLGTFLYVSASRSLRQETHLIALRNELEIAHQIQSALLPKLNKAMAGVEIQARYSPAGSVAGDFYDVLTGGHGLGVLIADVSGHGVPAALSASMVKVALRAQATQMAAPAEVMNGLNRTLCGILGDQFITAAYVFVDTEKRELRYAGAGHPPILLWKSATNQVQSLEQNGLFLGPFVQAEYSEVSSSFSPGDRCLLYTDGLVEASNEQGEEFGGERLRAFFGQCSDAPVDSACSALLNQVIVWSGGEPGSQQDDITFVLIEFQRLGRPK